MIGFSSLSKRTIFVFAIFMIAIASMANALEFSEYAIRGFEGKGQVEFINPEDLVLTKDGRIVVADQKNNRIQILSKEGDFIRYIPSAPVTDPATGKTEGSQEKFEELRAVLKKPTGLALDNENKFLYISCMDAHQIAVVDFSTGELVKKIGKWGKGQGELQSPMDVDIDSQGRIAVAEWRTQRVQIFDKDGKTIKEIIYQEETPKRGLKSIAPRGVHWMPDGNLVVSYPLYEQVVCWQPIEGQILWRYGIKGKDRGNLNNPSYITDGPDGNLLITDTKNHRLVEISSTGKYVYNYNVKRGSGPGKLIDPRGLALNDEAILIISDQGNNRIHFFKPGQATVMLREVKELALKDRWQEALPKIERVLYLTPNNTEARELMVNALYFFGDKAFSEGEFAKSEEYFRRVLRYRPDDPIIPQKLDGIFWASNQGLIANVVFGIIAIIVGLILLWILKVVFSRFILINRR